MVFCVRFNGLGAPLEFIKANGRLAFSVMQSKTKLFKLDPRMNVVACSKGT
ncbi:hypothetical protein [Peribacillus sp. SI8-4]|uniref:hypothetical protein n=1 Tax=Peribacillus sp. SI8-4 TaxID=3048009 RepID=UPI00255797E1|nr:hypothetical protein [Peribacillus sp. SI8-4]